MDRWKNDGVAEEDRKWFFTMLVNECVMVSQTPSKVAFVFGASNVIYPVFHPFVGDVSFVFRRELLYR